MVIRIPLHVNDDSTCLACRQRLVAHCDACGSRAVILCDSCGQRAVALSIGVRYRVADLVFRANRVHPCNCLLAIVNVTDGEPDPPDVTELRWHRPHRHVSADEVDDLGEVHVP
jgi:hypothetical protein